MFWLGKCCAHYSSEMLGCFKLKLQSPVLLYKSIRVFMAVSLAGQNLQVLHLSWGREEMTFLGMLFFFNLGHNLFLQRPWAYSISLVERSEHLPSAFISILHVIKLRFKQIKWFGMATSLCPAWGKNPRLSTHTSEHFTTPKAYGWAVGQFLDTKLTLFMLLPVL